MEKIINKILADAKLEADEIIKKAKEEANAEEMQAFKELNNEKEKIMQAERKKIEYSKENKISMAEVEARKIILEEKNNCINAVKEKIDTYIKRLNGKEYVNFIMEAIESISLNGKESRIILPSKQRKEIAEMLSNKDIQIQETDEFKSGFLLYDGAIEYNFNLDTVMQEQKEKIEEIITKKIF